MKRLITLSLCLVAMSGQAAAEAVAPPQDWFATGADAVQQRLLHIPNTGRAKNVILFVGDGMGVSTVTAARIFDGQSRGGAGEENLLSFESFPNVALVKTYNTNQQVPDSAGTASAMHTGVKTRAGMLGVLPQAHRGNCREAKAHPVKTAAEYARENGVAVGIVTTARLTHATPASVFAHSPERDWEADRDLPQDAKAAGCTSLARQLVEGQMVDFALGGGRNEFDKTLLDGWQAMHAGGLFLETADELATVQNQHPVLGLFAPSHLTFMSDRDGSNREPTLSQMTKSAIDYLQGRETGYYLLVEGGRIDHGHHAGIAEKALRETQEFSEAIKVALENVDLDETLILVTADHSHVFTMAGYPTRGNPILGLVKGNDASGEPKAQPTLALDGQPYTSLGYQNGPGAVEGDRPTPDTGPKARQQALVPTGYHSGETPHKSETHGGEDVALYAAGPRSYLASGVMEQHVIFHIIKAAFEWQ